MNDRYLGFEDFCVLNALGTADKYKGGYESRIFRRMREFVSPSEVAKSLEDLFRLFTLNCAIRNGDAHLKNFGVTYDAVEGTIKSAPVYDLVTTLAYMPNDTMALTLDGSTKWPDRKQLIRLAQTRSELPLKKAEEFIENTADAMASVAPDLKTYFSARQGEVGARMIQAWEAGIRDTLGVTRGLVQVQKDASKASQRAAKSDELLLEFLRQKGGSATGTLKAISNDVGIPLGTLNASIKRLIERGFLRRSSRSIAVVPRKA